jgi:hypothetical protein
MSLLLRRCLLELIGHSESTFVGSWGTQHEPFRETRSGVGVVQMQQRWAMPSPKSSAQDSNSEEDTERRASVLAPDSDTEDRCEE